MEEKEIKTEEAKKEKKALGIKADEETAAAWKAYWEELKSKTGIKNQEAAFRELLKLADIEKIKERVPGRSDDTEDFKTMLDQLMTKYLSCVDAYANARDRAVADVKIEMETKTRTIADLQKKQDEMKERIDKLEAALNESTVENNRLQVEVTKLNASISDKDALIQSLKNNNAAVDAVGAIEELKEIVAGMKKQKITEAKK